MSRRTDLEIKNLEKVSSKSMRRTMATIMSNRNVPTAELVAIGDWATEEMARRYIERLSLFAPGGRNYSDVALGTVAVDGCTNAVAAIVQPRKRQKTQERVPHKEKVISERQRKFLEEG